MQREVGLYIVPLHLRSNNKEIESVEMGLGIECAPSLGGASLVVKAEDAARRLKILLGIY